MKNSDVKRKEIFSLKSLWQPCHSVVKIPQNARRVYAGNIFMNFVSQSVVQLYCFLLTFSTDAIRNGMILLGVGFFLLYQLKDVIAQVVRTFSSYIGEKKTEILELDMAEKTVKITSRVSGKIRYEEKEVTNSSIMTNVGKYIGKYRELQESTISFIFSLGTFFISVIGSIYVATCTFNNIGLFSLTIIISIVIVGLLEYRRIMGSQEYFDVFTRLDRKATEERNDCVNMRSVCSAHTDFMINNYTSTIKERTKYKLKNGIKERVTGIKSSGVFAFSVLVVVVSAILSEGLNNLNAENFLSIVSLATVFSSILSNIQWRMFDLKTLISKNSELDKEAKLFSEIMEVYDKEKVEENISGDVCLNPFTFSYDVGNFTLVNERRRSFRKGEMILLKGDSGAGKSTLLKILCGEVSVGDNPKIKTIHYSSDGTLGSQSLLSEITFNQVNKDKLTKILKGVQIYDLLLEKAEDQDVFEYLDKTKGGLSTGMEDRLMLARTLYNLDDSDLVLIDEPIGGVDIETGRKIISFIKEYAAKEMKKIVVVTTHQYPEVIYEFKEIVDVKREGVKSIVV